jgi:hypothetical protein
MTDRHAGYIVVLDEDIREDDAELIINAIRMVKCVQSVVPVVSDYSVHIAEERADAKWREKMRRLYLGLDDKQ